MKVETCRELEFVSDIYTGNISYVNNYWEKSNKNVSLKKFPVEIECVREILFIA